MNEQWKPIAGIGGKYEVSCHGRVRHAADGRLVATGLSGRAKNQFVTAYMWLDKKPVSVPVHRLVAEAFIGPIPENYHTAHLDGSRLNNCLNNLRYVTPKENSSHMKIHGTIQIGEKNSKAKLTESKVIEMRVLADKGKMCLAISKIFGVDERTVRDAVYGKTWRHVSGPIKQRAEPTS